MIFFPFGTRNVQRDILIRDIGDFDRSSYNGELILTSLIRHNRTRDTCGEFSVAPVNHPRLNTRPVTNFCHFGDPAGFNKSA